VVLERAIARGFHYEVRVDGSLVKDINNYQLVGDTAGWPTRFPSSHPRPKSRPRTAIDVDSFSVPVLADWNADTLTDLLVGEKTAQGNGKVRVYLNAGTAQTPAFGEFFYAQRGTADLVVPATGSLEFSHASGTGTETESET